VTEVIYMFDSYTLDGDKRELRQRKLAVQLQPQVFDLLEFLLRNHDRVVSKDEMLAAVWGGRIVSESTLASRINAARGAIGDNGEDQRLIRTFLRKGVRFVGQVREMQTANDVGDAEWAKAMTTVVSQERPVFIRAFSSLWLPSGTPEQVQWFLDLARLSHSSENQAKFATAVGGVNVLDLLPMVEAPTIVFHCIRDNLIPFSQGRQLACSIPNARFVPLDSENHALISTEPAWVKMIEEMEAFLANGG
jgi:DNA-binding winged helix-turn-helix (wHTH) protein